jgi:gliding motility-associated-like protein
LNFANIANPIATPNTATTYRVTASSVGCIKTDSVRVNTYSFTTQLSATNVSCFGGSDGNLVAIPANGVAPYNYIWSNGAPDAATQSQLPMGNYSVTVNDANGCSATANQTITQPSVLQFDNPVVNDVKCFGASDGNISVQVIGGTPNYSYNWQPANTNSNSIQGLSIGNYSLTVSDSKGCFKDTTFVVAQPTELVLDTASTNVTCFGGSNGSATVIPSGGTPNYTYNWSNLTSQSDIQNIQAANYTVTVFDANQCSKQANFNISQPLQILLTTSIVKNVSCFGGNDGVATVLANNGISPFSYLWSNNQTTDSATNLNAATFNVTVTDNNNCTSTSNVTLQQPTLLQSNPTVNNVKCFGGNDGSIISNPNGGTPPYTFAWSNNQATQNAAQLSFGNYVATVTDANGCTHTFSRNVTQPDTLRATASAIRETCIAISDGKLIPNAFGGTPPYNFSYTRDQFSFTAIPLDTVKNLTPATYTLRVTDANSCSADAQATVVSPPKDEYDYIVEMPSCFGAAYQDGSIAVRGLESANAPFKFSLNNDGNFNSTGSFKKLGAGFYSIYIVNNNGCDTTIVVEVPEPQNAVLKIFPQDTTVNVGEKVLLDVVISPYPKSSITTYRWSPQQGLSCVDCANPVVTSYNDENIYEVIVTYNKGCIAKSSVTVFTEANPEIYTPNMFTPNDDGLNDKFFVYGLGIRDFDLKIFNRWGEKVYESTEQTQGWDGFFRNEKQEPGAYVYYLQVVYLNNKKFSKTGSVTLVR